MKSRKLLTILFFTSIYFTSAFSQGLYVKLGGGYAMGMTKQSMPFNYNSTNTDDVTIISQFWYSLGKGITPELEAGYMFNGHFGFGINATYLYGTNNTRYDKHVDAEDDVYEYFYSRMVNIIPGIQMSAGYDKFNPYAKAGLVLGFGKIITESENDDFYSKT